MTPPLSPVNIAAFVLQITVLVGAGALLLRAFRIDAPRAVLAYWRTLLLACLALPFLQPWTTVDVPATTAAIEAISSAPSVAATTSPRNHYRRPGNLGKDSCSFWWWGSLPG